MTHSLSHLRRRGFSLLEIMLALAILGGSLAVLSQIAGTGSDAAREARELVMARILCQAKLNEVLLDATLGQTPTTITDAVAEPFDSQATSSFAYNLEVEQTPLEGMLSLRVSVQASGPDGDILATYQLTRWIIDPALGLVEAEAEEEAAKAEAAGTAEATGDEA